MRGAIPVCAEEGAHREAIRRMTILPNNALQPRRDTRAAERARWAGGQHMHMRKHILMVLIALSVAATSVAVGQQGDKLGKVEFPNSCSPAVQEKLLRGIAMLHSFYYSATQRAFEEVAAEDNSCVITAWGYAAILMSNPLQGVGASPKGAQQAQAAIDKGRQMGGKTQRERDYLEAVAAYYE